MIYCRKDNHSDGSTTEYAYNSASALTEQKEVDKDNRTRRVITYIYDDEGNLKSEQRQGVDIGKRDESIWYGYDDGNRLVKTNIDGVVTNYTYDNAGNLLSDGIYTYTYDVQNKLLSKTNAEGTTGYTYDAAGNLIKETNPNGSVTYAYNAQNKLIKGEKSNGESSSYTYNATGARVQTVQVRENVNAGYQNSGLNDGSGGVDYIDFFSDGRNDWQKTWESEVGTIHQNNLETVTTDYIVDYLSTGNRDLIATEQGSLTKRYVYDGTGGRISAEFAYADNTQRGTAGENIASDIGVGINKVWYRSSHLGSSLFTVDEDGKVIAHTIYDPWGKPLTEPTVDLNHSGMDNGNNYTGYTYDVVLDLYFAQNRFYDPRNHRFTQEDIVKDGHNWYTYVQNNPLMFTDPTGLMDEGGGGAPATTMVSVSSSKVAEWASTMWVIAAVDGALPVGDLIYIAGFGICYLLKEKIVSDLEGVIVYNPSGWWNTTANRQKAKTISVTVTTVPKPYVFTIPMLHSEKSVGKTPGKTISLDYMDDFVCPDAAEGEATGEKTGEENTGEKDGKFKGKPGEVKTDGKDKIKIGDDGRATRVRHNSDHGKPKYHTDPHDHDIGWTPEGNPDFGPPINYPNGAPVFK